MVSQADLPVVPWRMPSVVIAFLCIVIALLSLAAVGLVVGLTFGGIGLDRFRNLGLSWPDDAIGRVILVQSAATLIAMFLLWLFSILVVAAHASGSHRQAGANAVALVRVSIAITLVRFAASTSVPFAATGDIGVVLPILATSVPFLVAELALFLAADFYFSAIRDNAPP